MENSLGKGSLSSIASSLGFDIGEMQTTDAITPLLYPDLMEDNGFIINLLTINVKSKDGSINTTYYDYMRNQQKEPWWLAIFSSKKEEKNVKSIDAYNLSKKDDDIVSDIRDNITLHVNSKSGVISISAQDQDAYICKNLADSVREKLQAYITNYRTNKARTDFEYYKKLTLNAKQEYEKVRRQYANMADASTNVKLRSVELKMEDVENDMQLKFNTYTNLNNQLQAAKAKVQERTPAFTILKGAAVPIKPAGPKRMIFVAVITLLTFLGTAIWILRKDISEIFV
jgi:LPS O-antigen subunit length determinant protein (WzzB/FepE family)